MAKNKTEILDLKRPSPEHADLSWMCKFSLHSKPFSIKRFDLAPQPSTFHLKKDDLHANHGDLSWMCSERYIHLTELGNLFSSSGGNAYISHDMLLNALDKIWLNQNPIISPTQPLPLKSSATPSEREQYYEELYEYNKKIAKNFDIARIIGDMQFARTQLNWAAYDLNERILKTQIYKHIEVLIATRMAAPLTITGIVMFIIEASIGDINFHSQEVQLGLAVGLFGSFMGVLGAAYFIKNGLDRKWGCDADLSFKKYKEELEKYFISYLSVRPSNEFFNELEKNVKYAQVNWLPHEEPDELNMVGVRLNALKGIEGDSEEIRIHKQRRNVSASWIVALNMGALICGIFITGLTHERKSSIPKKPHFEFPELPETGSESRGHSNGFLENVSDLEWAAYASVGLLLLGIAVSIVNSVITCYKANQQLLRFSAKKNEVNTIPAVQSHCQNR